MCNLILREGPGAWGVLFRAHTRAMWAAVSWWLVWVVRVRVWVIVVTKFFVRVLVEWFQVMIWVWIIEIIHIHVLPTYFPYQYRKHQ